MVQLDAFIKQVIDVVIWILVVAIVIFYVVIPLLEMLGHLRIPGL